MTLLKSPPIYTPQSPTRPAKRTVGRSYQAIIAMTLITTIMGGGIGTRLATLQLVEGKQNVQEANRNRIRVIPKQPERGKILDRKGRILASSRLSHSVYVWPLAQRKTTWPRTLRRLSQLLNIPEAEIQNRMERAGYSSPYLLRVAWGLSREQVTALEEYSSELDGIVIDVETVRHYPNGKVASHVLGYTGEMNDEDLERRKDRGYRLGDVIGQMGAEAAFESQLRGEWGGQQVEVDGLGQVVQFLGTVPAKAGQDVRLTIDLEIQKAAEAALGDAQGAIVAIDPNNGAVLAMVSRPAFDPNIFSTRITEKTWAELQSADNPFVNRALQGFAPASTFKIVTTAAALESGKYSPYTVLGTFPYLTVGGIQFWDWNRAGFGPLDFAGAMAWSSDTFFYQIALGVGGPTLIEWTRKFGFGQKTGIELAGEEASGLVADETWKNLELGEDWYAGDSVNMSIGQGYLQASPLQVAVMFAVPANGGYRVKPHLLKDNEEAKNWRESLDLEPVTVDILQRGLRQVVTNGTGGAMNDPTLPPNAGKTGTAEDPPRLSHAWYGGYAPYDKPEIIVVAFGENSGGGGGAFAAPKVKQVLDAYFKMKNRQG
ncbi:penicillin-binding protein 2 [Desertifilum sp. FACHB-1129]|uniref:Penicillin-binding protein 2 n=1 Tax=Desertifilum tharense IPPAS B-1220 TaxID=1781255 RepID=A0A1E5QI41_9CYAN|nr:MULTISPECIES: penicillin-binding protein 2 [Desertifilum]MDA0209444.1 penicillin-binding protein 2 [Cyanobacteria bacterium FC1]MBD2314323.1 penicillin-binding protein 2 [Desertifilum sp. FACHB-1129]MBD2324600.1 penicillin-binding protein 2 [Desertifilum sp. FACHB-866]MBD2334691.1 penicillin-binding protein 2 [Desertifilum sp. FACHB-868]OEJ74264.1 penicillin-binding protein 2 [Desertifilum tharense IPPAS B-1220]